MPRAPLLANNMELLPDPAVRAIIQLQARVDLLESYVRIAVAAAGGAITLVGVLVAVLVVH